MSALNWRHWFPAKYDERLALVSCWVLTIVLFLFFGIMALLTADKVKLPVGIIYLRLVMGSAFALALTVLLHVGLLGWERQIRYPTLRASLAGVGIFLLYLLVWVLNDPEI